MNPTFTKSEMAQVVDPKKIGYTTTVPGTPRDMPKVPVKADPGARTKRQEWFAWPGKLLPIKE